MGVKLDSITYKTDISKFMDVNKITNLAEDYIDSKYIADMNEALNMLKDQMTNGGLSPYAFVFEGVAPLYTEAGNIYVEIEKLSLKGTNLKKSIIQNANIQRKNQFVRLKKKIEEQVAAWEEEKELYAAKDTALRKEWDYYEKNGISTSNLEDKDTYSKDVEEIEEKIKKYNAKIEDEINPEISRLANIEGVG